MNPVTQPFGPCPCRLSALGNQFTSCREEGTKLKKNGHLVRCKCRPCIGLRNRRSGQKAQARMHKRLGGEGFTPTHEEGARPYVIEVAVMPESKTGGQVPASLDKFLSTDWFRRALDQSARAAHPRHVRPGIRTIPACQSSLLLPPDVHDAPVAADHHSR